jgi:hypothetical protein
MSITSLISECMEAGITLTPALDYDGPEEALSDGLETRLRRHKFDVLRQLVGAAEVNPHEPTIGMDWRVEWLKEYGMLAVRCRDSPDHEVAFRLRELLAETPRTQAEWLHLGDMIAQVESDLRREGKLPPIPNFEA